MLFNYVPSTNTTGLEPILQRWGVNVGMSIVQDMENTTSSSGTDIGRQQIRQASAVESARRQTELQMILPRPVGAVDGKNPPAGRAASDGTRVLQRQIPRSPAYPAAPPHSYPLMAAVEQKNSTGVANPRGTTRILVVGDSIFLGNWYIDGGRATTIFSVMPSTGCWTVPSCWKASGPRPVTEFRLQMTRLQQREVRWVLLGALPGAVLLLGGLIWLARRK